MLGYGLSFCFLEGYVRASDGAKAEESGLRAALVADPEALVKVRERYATWQDRVVTRGCSSYAIDSSVNEVGSRL